MTRIMDAKSFSPEQGIRAFQASAELVLSPDAEKVNQQSAIRRLLANYQHCITTPAYRENDFLYYLRCKHQYNGWKAESAWDYEK